MEKTNKVLVLTDLKTSKEIVLKSALELAKKINAEIHVFCAKKAIDVVKGESQLSAIRNINNAGNTLKKEMQEFTQHYSKNHNIAIKNSYAFGNVKNEIDSCISILQPAAIVLGEKKAKRLNLFGDNVTKLVQKKYKGDILIVKNNLNT